VSFLEEGRSGDGGEGSTFSLFMVLIMVGILSKWSNTSMLTTDALSSSSMILAVELLNDSSLLVFS
jgi:hypothetical protein